jgi:MYXO-CTERM domain-containing protein
VAQADGSCVCASGRAGTDCSQFDCSVSCDDGDPCTTDTCTTGSGCAHATDACVDAGGDAAIVIDASTDDGAIDGDASTVDGGSIDDAGASDADVAMDGAVIRDAGRDAAASRADATPADGASGMDAGTTPPVVSAGCGCRTGGRTRGSSALVLIGLVLGSLVRRRRSAT